MRIKHHLSSPPKLYFPFVLMCVSLLPLSCGKLFVGNYEFLEYEFYYTDQAFGPQISANPQNLSNFISAETAFAEELIGVESGAVQITIQGVRVESRKNNYTIKNEIEIEEKVSGGKWEKQSEFSVLPSAELTKVAAVLVLDMSTSISDAGLEDNVKSYAKEFAKIVTDGNPSSVVSVVFFSGRDQISSTSFYNSSSLSQLNTLIDNYTNYNSRTALFQAVKQGLDSLNGYPFPDNRGSKALVIFTDGGDNDSNDPTSIQAEIAADPILKIGIGLNGKDFRKDELKSIVSDNKYFVKVNKERDLKEIFDEVAQQVKSVYDIKYLRSNQTRPEHIRIKFCFNVDKIKS